MTWGEGIFRSVRCEVSSLQQRLAISGFTLQTTSDLCAEEGSQEEADGDYGCTTCLGLAQDHVTSPIELKRVPSMNSTFALPLTLCS